MTTKIKANSRKDIERLTRAILLTPAEDRWKVLAHIYDSELMKFKGFNRILLKLLKKYRGGEGVYKFMFLMNKFSITVIPDFMYSTSHHILYGKDTEDSDSVGGWSQREIDLFLSKIKFSSLEETNDESLQEPV